MKVQHHALYSARPLVSSYILRVHVSVVPTIGVQSAQCVLRSDHPSSGMTRDREATVVLKRRLEMVSSVHVGGATITPSQHSGDGLIKWIRLFAPY
jgi:hypothetical protein